jgi:Glycosyltransferase family 87
MTSALVLTAGICWLALLHFALQPLPLDDLHAPVMAAADWMRGSDPYRLAIADPTTGALSGSGFVYPPYTLPLFALMSLMGFSLAAFGWQLIQVVALAGLVWELSAPRTVRRVASLSIMAVLFYPIVSNLVLGQAGLLTITLLWLASSMLRRGQDRVAGMLVAAGSWLKLFPLALVVIFVMRHRWQAVAVSAMGLLLPLVVTLPWVATRWPEYITQVLFSKITSGTTFPDDQSVFGAINRSLTANPFQPRIADLPVLAHTLGAVVAVSALSVVLITAWRLRQSDVPLAYALVLAALPLTLPYSWQHYYVLALPLLWLVTSRAIAQRRLWLILGAAVAFTTLSIAAATIDLYYWEVQTWPVALKVIDLNSSVIGAILLLWSGMRLAMTRSAPQTQALAMAA